MEERTKRNSRKAKTRCPRHPLIVLGIVLELLLVGWMIAGLFAPAYCVEILPDTWPQDVQQTEGVQLAEDGVHISVPTASEGEEPSNVAVRFQTESFALKPGAYLITVAYQADSTSLSTTAGQVLLRESGLTSLLYAQDLPLDGAHTTVAGRAWVVFGAKVNRARLDVVTTGQCNFVLQSITVQEQLIYRWVRLLGAILLLAVANLIVWQLVMGGSRTTASARSKQKIAVALVGIAFVASLPFFTDVLRNGDDLTFHIYRISNLAQELRQGQFPVRMFTTALNGFGYPTPLYYCDIFLYLPALLYNCMVPLQLCYQIYGVLVSLCTAVSCYGSLRLLRCTEKISLLCSALYVLCAYRLSNVFMRAAVGEYTAMVFLPLVVCGVALLYRVDRPTWKAGVPLAVGMAGLAMCHLLSLEMTGLFLVLFVLAAAKRTFCKARIVALIRAALLAAGLSAWFLVPMLHSMVTQNIQATNVYPYNFQQRGVDLMDLFAPVPLNYAQQNGVRGELGLGLIVALVVCLGVVWQRGPLKQVRGRRMHILQYTLGFGVLAMVLSLRIFPWNILFSHFPSTVLHKFLGMVQFPWRYLGLASVLLCVSVAIALQLLRDWGYAGTQKVAAALLLGTVVYTAAFYGGLEQMQPTTSNIYGAANVDSLQIGGGKDYVLPGEVDYNYAYPTQLSDSLVIQRYEKNDGVACITLENTADTEGSVVLPINDYGNYTATDDQGNILPLSTSENSLLVLTVPGGYSGMVSVSYREPLLWRVAELLSLVTAVVLCIAGIRSRKVKRPLQQLSCDLPGQTR